MAIIANKNTAQPPITTTGAITGTQMLKFIQAPRVYTKTTDATPTIPNLKSNGVTPTGWTDLGIVAGVAKFGVEKKINQVKTGIDNYLRAAYTDEKVGTVEFTLSQLDDVVFTNITGLAPSTIQAGSKYTFAVGAEDLNQLALLLVVQNKLDGKEWQYYSPNVYMNYSIDQTGDELVLKCSALLPFFTAAGETREQMLASSIFAAGLASGS